MPSCNVKFSNAQVYDVVKFDVKLGEVFGVDLVDHPPTVMDWYSKADDVLDITQTEDGTAARVEATGIGETKIRIYDQADAKVMELFINVLEEIPAPAASLGLKVGQPEPKGAEKAKFQI